MKRIFWGQTSETACEYIFPGNLSYRLPQLDLSHYAFWSAVHDVRLLLPSLQAKYRPHITLICLAALVTCP